MEKDGKEKLEQKLTYSRPEKEKILFPGDEGYGRLYQHSLSNNEALQNAFSAFAKKQGLILPDNATYDSYYEQHDDNGMGIIYYELKVSNFPALVAIWIIGNGFQDVRETEHTRKLLKSSLETAHAELAIAV